MDDKTTEVDGKDAHVLDLDPDRPPADQVHGAAADGPGNAHAPGAPRDGWNESSKWMIGIQVEFCPWTFDFGASYLLPFNLFTVASFRPLCCSHS